MLVSKTLDTIGEIMILRNYLWLTRNVSVLKGALIAEGSVIGHSSVVTGRCSTSYSVYAGSPARYIKEGIVWSRFRSSEY